MIPKIHNLTQIKKQNNDGFEGIMNAKKMISLKPMTKQI